ncbi:uncharacterized protein BYT42DRAFT_564494 [Radiomyces spectabilis]|uniref:uncharacterized protein n=1 Tax=Radiomyces spectabilis TaxID=64574 RepID=UPI0022204A47|nr:uncharacterized protein BYT42DRAFT_564494 [Radiomyces spectabilis]KAI8385046.1 hypothetical protein BYT42DRAFT_564494 [Radiomyces spectabilis]
MLEGGDSQNPMPNLHWWNVGVAASFILINGLMSVTLGLKLEKSLFVSSVRCLVQLTIMGLILEDVFKANNPYLVMFMTFVMVFLSTNEVVYHKSEMSYGGMYPSVLLSTGFSTFFVGILGTKYALSEEPFWIPEFFIPTVGLLLGVSTSGIAVGLSTCLSEVGTHSDEIELYLAFGASRWEAAQSVAIEAIRLAMLPSINQMSVIGLITIPGAMTGQILGGAPILNAVRYQQIITFLISATTGLAVLLSVIACLNRLIDDHHRLRPERVSKREPSLFRDLRRTADFIYLRMKAMFSRSSGHGVDDERRPLLS